MTFQGTQLPLTGITPGDSGEGQPQGASILAHLQGLLTRVGAAETSLGEKRGAEKRNLENISQGCLAPLVDAPQPTHSQGRAHIAVDASDTRMGAVLQQIQTLRPLQAHYSAFGKELLAGLQRQSRHFRTYVEGKRIHILTDSQAPHLRSCHKQERRSPTRREAPGFLAQYPRTYGTSKASTTTAADALSRVSIAIVEQQQDPFSSRLVNGDNRSQLVAGCNFRTRRDTIICESSMGPPSPYITFTPSAVPRGLPAHRDIRANPGSPPSKVVWPGINRRCREWSSRTGSRASAPVIQGYSDVPDDGIDRLHQVARDSHPLSRTNHPPRPLPRPSSTRGYRATEAPATVTTIARSHFASELWRAQLMFFSARSASDHGIPPSDKRMVERLHRHPEGDLTADPPRTDPPSPTCPPYEGSFPCHQAETQGQSPFGVHEGEDTVCIDRVMNLHHLQGACAQISKPNTLPNTLVKHNAASGALETSPDIYTIACKDFPSFTQARP
ncbi:uncharacterized protein LOC134789133, partial [Penaeus indicus]|uniref:uncharacterized protein LOC134789133 n=1 Tax=Penaeus indicus TaxID=29960 RepID=UPI00300CF027